MNNTILINETVECINYCGGFCPTNNNTLMILKTIIWVLSITALVLMIKYAIKIKKNG